MTRITGADLAQSRVYLVPYPGSFRIDPFHWCRGSGCGVALYRPGEVLCLGHSDPREAARLTRMARAAEKWPRR